MLTRDTGSLASLFRFGILAERMRDIALAGPRDTLRRSRSLSLLRTRVRSVRGFTGTGLFVAAPGREVVPEELAALGLLGLSIVATGPPSFRFIDAQCSGKRAEKLLRVRFFKTVAWYSILTMEQ